MTADLGYTVTSDRLRSVSGISYRQLDHWVDRGYLRPANQVTGTGNFRRFTADEMRVAVTMARLVAAGLTVAAAHRVARGETELAPGVRVLVEAVTS